MSIADRASMKLQSKQREGGRVHRTYDQAQTPMQRLLASGALSPKKQQELLRITEALDPLRLLQQLEHLQKALWRYAVTSSSESPVPASPLPFSVKQCTEEKVSADGIAGTPPSLRKSERRKKYQRSGRPHDWRTRIDPFEGEWEQLSPGRYRPTQVRTLQRGPGKLRARLLVTFDDQWGEEVVNGQTSAPELRAEIIVGVS